MKTKKQEAIESLESVMSIHLNGDWSLFKERLAAIRAEVDEMTEKDIKLLKKTLMKKISCIH